MKITALWSCSREDTIHPRKGSEDKYTHCMCKWPHPVSCHQVHMAFVRGATPLVIEIPCEEWEFSFRVMQGCTHIAMPVHAKHQWRNSASLGFNNTSFLLETFKVSVITVPAAIHLFRTKQDKQYYKTRNDVLWVLKHQTLGLFPVNTLEPRELTWKCTSR